jgi:SAM-dependent methyltransferase
VSVFTASADLYDLIYSAFKNYGEEAAKIAVAIRACRPDAVTVLDVACGTGKHALYLSRDHGFRVDGVDLEARFVELAQARNPEGSFTQADMIALDLGSHYDAVLCLFSSIGYARTTNQLAQAVAAMARHVSPEGVLIIEPWFEPGKMEDGYVTCASAEADGISVCRMGRTEIDGRNSTVRFQYLIGTRDGIRHAHETHELGLFSRDEMEAAFQSASMCVEYDPNGLIGRGLYVARHRE